MKSILAPTDFSNNSLKAIDFAAEIAIKFNAKLTLLHAYLPPIIMSEVPVIVAIPEEMKQNANEHLKKISANLNLRHGNKLLIEIECLYGLPVDAIVSYAAVNAIDLVVMGIQGEGFIQEKLIGSVTTDVIKKSLIPVLSIHQATHFKAVKNICFATDYLELKNTKVLQRIKDVLGIFQSHIYLLHVLAETEMLPEAEKAAELVKLEHALADFDHSFHFVINKNIAEGIHEFTESRHIDLIVMVPRKHHFVETILKGRVSKKVAFHNRIPLLTIHE